MKSIEWLFEKLWNEPKDKFTWHSILDKAIEMHKQEIINASNGYTTIELLGVTKGEYYYQETFVSKGSDELEQVVNDYDDDPTWIDDEVELPQQEISDNSPKEENKTSFGEISDEEIEKFADEELGTIRTDFDFGVIQGMKWYREQLKKL
jgi:hypothetical protein